MSDRPNRGWLGGQDKEFAAKVLEQALADRAALLKLGDIEGAKAVTKEIHDATRSENLGPPETNE